MASTENPGRHGRTRTTPLGPSAALLEALDTANEQLFHPDRPGAVGRSARTIGCGGTPNVEEALLGICRAPISVRTAASAAALWGCGLDAADESCRRLEGRITTWLHREIAGRFPYLILSEARLKQRHVREARRLCLMLAVGVNADGYRQVLGVGEGPEGDEAAWRGFLLDLRARGLVGVDLCVCPWGPPLIDGVGEIFDGAPCQYSVDAFCQAVLAAVPAFHLPTMADLLKQAFASENRPEAAARLQGAVASLRRLGSKPAAALLAPASELTLRYYAAPRAHWRSVRSGEALRRAAREIRRGASALGAGGDSEAAVLFAAARLRHLVRTSWGRHRYLAIGTLTPAG